MTHRQVTAALFVICLAITAGLIGWAVADVVGLLGGFGLGLFSADLITRALERGTA